MSYNNFAYIYDELMKDIDYSKWVDYLEEIFLKHNFNPKLILELACGTGNITIEATKRGYEMIGVDLSADMLSVAQQKARDNNQNILFLNQDMTDFELYGTVDCVICCMDGINYITSKTKLEKMFSLVKNYLNNGGLFIFDIRSPYALSTILGNNMFFEDNKDVTYIWQNQFDKNKKISNMDLTFFVKEKNYYERFDETHTLKSYSIEDIKSILNKFDFKIFETFEHLKFNNPSDMADRICFVAGKK